MADDWNPPDYEDVPELDVADVDRLHATLDELSERSVLGDAGADFTIWEHVADVRRGERSQL